MNKSKAPFETTLTGSDGPVDGVVTQATFTGYDQAFEFQSIDGSLHLLIGKNARGHWERIDGSEPYLSSWIDELAEKVFKTGH